MSDTPPDPTPILDLMNAFRESAAMFAGISLGVFDHLASAPLDLSTLARHTGTNPDALLRLLDLFIGLGLLTKSGDLYQNTPVTATYLCKLSPRRMTGYITYSDRVLWHLWANLADAIREGSNRWKQTFGLDGPIFSNFFRTEEDKAEFLWGMHGFGQISSPAVVTAFDLSGFKHFVDLGGATGHLAIAACKRYPQLRATVFDLPQVIPQANEVLSAETDIADRICTVAGDFFVDPLPSADLYALGRIVHDWNEEKIRKLLQRIYDALPPDGALLIAEKVLHDDRAGPRWAQLQSLNMLICTEGKERTLTEYTDLLKSIGFRDVQGRATAKPLDAVMATK